MYLFVLIRWETELSDKIDEIIIFFKGVVISQIYITVKSNL